MSDELTPGTLEAAETVTQSAEGTTEAGTGAEEALTPDSAEGSKVQPYTDDELAQLLESNAAIDRKRLTPTQIAIERAMAREADRGVTQKFQEIAEMKRQLEEERKQAQPQTPENALFNAYMQNPVNVISNINQQIAKLETVSPYDDTYAEARASIAKLITLKDNLAHARENYYMNIAQAKGTEQYIETQRREIQTAIPNFEKVAPMMEEYAVKDLGLTKDDLAKLTDVVALGGTANRLTKALYKVFSTLNAAKLKEIPTNPNVLVRAGSGGGTPSTEDVIPDDPAEFQKWWKARHKGK